MIGTLTPQGQPVSSGSSGEDKIELLVSQAKELITKLPADKRTEIENVLAQLEQAKASNNHSEQSMAIVNLTMLLMNNKDLI